MTSLTTRIGRRVNFAPPQDVARKGGSGGAGTIVDEVWGNPEILDAQPHYDCDEYCWGDYAFCAQLIEWDDRTRMVRLAYYRRRCGEDFWSFASQMTVTAETETIKLLLDSTLAKDWFNAN